MTGAEHEHELTCDEVVELVTDYLEGALPAGDRTRFELHLVTCRGCERYLDQMRGTITAVGRLRGDEVAPEAMDELLDAFRGWRQRTAGE
jgi:anti-sigma factor RsiW